MSPGLIALALLVIALVILYKAKTTIYKNYLYYINEDFYKVLDRTETHNVSVNNIPTELKGYITCMNIENIEEVKTDSTYILTKFIDHLKVSENIKMNIDDLFIFDELNFSGSYFPSAHTDIEWNKIKNDGFQVWSLIENKESTGNMFILYNKYLYDKYKDDTIFLRFYKGKIAVVKNCYDAEFLWYINPTYIHELITIDDFVKHTKKYYLNFKAGDSILFAKNVIHMSDYRNKKSKRKAFNFRVAKTNNNQLFISETKCGYVHSLKLN